MSSAISFLKLGPFFRVSQKRETVFNGIDDDFNFKQKVKGKLER